MLHRVFTSIDLPEELKNRLLALKNDYPDLPARWTNRENIHITLNFLGNVDDNQLKDVLDKAESVALKYEPFVIETDRILCGPPGKFPPRMVWLNIKENEALAKLQRELENELFSLESFRFKKSEQRKYHPHITLARIKSFAFRKMSNPPDINIPLDFSFEVASFEIVESELEKGGSIYTILKTIDL